MEKTLAIHLADQRDAIHEAIINAPSPDPQTWASKIIWEQARIHFAKLVLDASSAEL